jgi:hypothetical protein
LKTANIFLPRYNPDARVIARTGSFQSILLTVRSADDPRPRGARAASNAWTSVLMTAP